MTGDGVSLREHLEASERQTGRTPPGLDLPPIPFIFERPMSLWQRLHSGRSMGGLGMAPFSWQDYHAFTSVTGERLSPGDLAAVQVIEGEFFASQSAAEARRAKAKSTS